MNLRDYNLKFNKMPCQWDEAMPIGNGNMGCLLYGDNPVCLSVDRIDLWDARPHPTTLEKDFNYQTLVELAKREDAESVARRNRLFEQIYNELPYPSKITAGRIELRFRNGFSASAAQVDIKDAAIETKGKKTSISAFVHATRPVGVARIRGDFEIDLHIPDYISKVGHNDKIAAGEGGNIVPADSLQYPPAEIVRQDDWTYYIQTTYTDFVYGLFVYRKRSRLHSEIFFTVLTGKDALQLENKAKKLLVNTADIGYDTLIREHTAYWHKYWKKSAVHLGDEILEKTYYRSWYLFASTSRKGAFPMPLQGVWTADSDNLPPWRGDYHHDTNTQLSYQGFLKANHWDEGSCFVDYLWENRSAYQRFAAEFYGVDGLLIPGVSTIDGKPMGGWAHYSLSPTMSVWTAQSFDEYFLYSGDLEFLKTRAYPFLRDIATAIGSLLTEKNDKLYLPLSTSPEIHDDTVKAYLTPNSNFDLSLLRYLYSRLIAYCKILGYDAAEYDAVLSKLDDIAVIDGVVALSPDEQLTESHRHFSHLMALYPLHLINYDTPQNRALYQRSMQHLENLGTSEWVGFSFAMAAQIYAMAEDGNKAYENLFKFCDGFVGENGFHLNGDFKNKGYSSYHYRPFTLEALFGYCDALQEMLFQQHRGYLHFFPSLPEKWQNNRISFEKFRGYNGLTVGAVFDGGHTKEAHLQTEKKTTVVIKNTFGTDCLLLRCGAIKKTVESENGYFHISLQNGTTILTCRGEE
ncbi:MAG: hypothetical protein MJ132_03240 [Clostridia bacterium]|nr:hypothetical protein [Clostridia bacterium]